MDILVNVINQKLKVATNQKTFVAGTQEFIRFIFDLSDDWIGLLNFVQFQQNNKTYNVYLDENNAAYLPPEIEEGDMTIALQGNLINTIAKSFPLVFRINRDSIKSDGNSTEITLTLYDQLAGSIASIEDRMTSLENNDAFINEIHNTTETKMQEYLENGEFAAMTIGDGTISRCKIDSSFENDLKNIEDDLIETTITTDTISYNIVDLFGNKSASEGSDEYNRYISTNDKAIKASTGELLKTYNIKYHVSDFIEVVVGQKLSYSNLRVAHTSYTYIAFYLNTDIEEESDTTIKYKNYLGCVEAADNAFASGIYVVPNFDTLTNGDVIYARFSTYYNLNNFPVSVLCSIDNVETVKKFDRIARSLPYGYDSIFNIEKIADEQSIQVSQCGDYAFTNSFNFTVENGSNSDCMIIFCDAYYEGASESPTPEIEYEITDGETSYFKSLRYRIRNKMYYDINEWRVPPMNPKYKYCRISVIIPDGVTLHIRDFHNTYGDRTSTDCAVRLNSHFGLRVTDKYVQNITPLYNLAAKCGYKTLVCSPYMTANGVIVMTHNRDISGFAYNPDGSRPESDTYFIEQMTYGVDQTSPTDLLYYSFGGTGYYSGAKIPTIDDYLDICAKTGMSPMVSAHFDDGENPAWKQADNWQIFKSKLLQYGLLEKFHVKSFSMDVLAAAFSVFGETIEGYTKDDGHWSQFVSTDFADENSNVIVKCRVVCERQPKAWTKYETLPSQMHEKGYGCSAYNITTAEEYYKLLSMGVTEFTDDFNCNQGLNW